MTVYVDNMRRYAQVGRVKARWSHLMADTHDELMEFAAWLGLKAEWVQHAGKPIEHFDLVDAKRTLALELGAEPMIYGREGGLFTMLKAARLSDDPDRIAVAESRFLAERALNLADAKASVLE